MRHGDVLLYTAASFAAEDEARSVWLDAEIRRPKFRIVRASPTPRRWRCVVCRSWGSHRRWCASKKRWLEKNREAPRPQ